MKVQVSPISNDADLEKALEEIRSLWGSPADTADGQRLDVLMDLVEAYERRHHPVPPPDPIDAIKFAMDQQGLKPSEVGAMLGNTARIYDLLSGRRKLSLRMIRVLHSKLGIPLESLIGSG